MRNVNDLKKWVKIMVESHTKYINSFTRQIQKSKLYMQRKHIWVLGFIDRNSEWIQIYVKIL